MIADSIKFKNYLCFKNDWVGFDTIKPVNIIIGKNNSGKSHLLDLVEIMCKKAINSRNCHYLCSGTLSEPELLSAFPKNINGGMLVGNHWIQHGCHFIGKKVEWEVASQNIVNVSFIDGFDFKSPYGENSTKARIECLTRLLIPATHCLFGKIFRHLQADRDIHQEAANNTLTLSPDGAGATNIIRRFITSSKQEDYHREIIQVEMLEALNDIFAKDGCFSEIQIQNHEGDGVEKPADLWEICLGETGKGLLPLNSLGSGLKTVILVLLNLLVMPKIMKQPASYFVFAFEELENNLHPSLLRRLFQFIEHFALDHHTKIFLTTHSSTALDLFGASPSAQILHVTHDGQSARTKTVSAHFEKLGVISELGAKPSDLLQANGIIWLEGPSDCLYMNKWIDLFGGGRFQEGRDYICAFYGGALLARTQFVTPEKAEEELVNLFRVNPNIVVVCDGDRTAPGSRVKDRVRRIRSEVRGIPGAHIWVTDAKEIENYIPGAVIAKALALMRLPDPGRYDIFFPRKGAKGKSYIESRLKRKSLDKMELASLAVPHMDKNAMRVRFEWEKQMKTIVEHIESWNK